MDRNRPMTYADLPRVLTIERASFPSPWSAAMFVLEMSRSRAVCIVAERDGRLCGYLVCSLVAGDWHLMNVAVDPEARRSGIAASLMDSLLERLPRDARMTLEVRPSNLAALAFYAGNGFLVAGRRIGYYADTGEDALIMWRTPATLRGSLDDVPAADRSLA